MTPPAVPAALAVGLTPAAIASRLLLRVQRLLSTSGGLVLIRAMVLPLAAEAIEETSMEALLSWVAMTRIMVTPGSAGGHDCRAMDLSQPGACDAVARPTRRPCGPWVPTFPLVGPQR